MRDYLNELHWWWRDRPKFPWPWRKPEPDWREGIDRSFGLGRLLDAPSTGGIDRSESQFWNNKD